MCGFCRTGKHGNTMRDGIPIFFFLLRKENGHSWSKKKTLRDDLTQRCQIIKTGPSRTADKIRKSPTGLRYTRILNRHIPAFEGAEQNGRGKPNRRISAPVRSASLRTTRSVSGFILVALRPLGGWFSCPSLVSGGVPKVKAPKAPPGRIKRPALLAAHQGLGIVLPSFRAPGLWGLVSKGGAEAPGLVSLGVRAKSKRPGAFSSGVWGGFFSEKNAPHVPAVETVCGAGNYRKARRCRALSLNRNHDGRPSKFKLFVAGNNRFDLMKANFVTQRIVPMISISFFSTCGPRRQTPDSDKIPAHSA